METIQSRLSPEHVAAPARNVFKRSVRVAIVAYLLFLCWQIVSTFSPNVFLPWFSSSDENVVVAEIIRFSNLDFHQQFYDMPGTPLMLFGAAQWSLFYWWSVIVHGFQGGTNLFSFQHLQQLFTLMRAENVAFFLLSALVLFRIVSKVANPYAAAAAATLVLMNAAYAETAASLRVEPMAMCFMLAAILVLTECRWESAPFWAGLLGGVAIACRLHSVMATLPILVLLLFTQTWGKSAEYSACNRRGIAALAGILFLVSALLYYFFGSTSGPLKTEYPLAFALLAKASLMLCFGIAAIVSLYLLPKSRHAVVNTMTPKFFGLIGGVAIGFLLGVPTVFIQYAALLRSLNFYLGQYTDAVAIHLSVGERVTSHLNFYLKVIASDDITLVLLVSGVGLVVLMPRWRALWPYLAVGIGFFFSKPLDMVRGAHHVALWLPFYATLCAVPIAAVCEALETRGRVWHYVIGPLAMVALLVLHAEVKNGPAALASIGVGRAERLRNVERSRTWIQSNTAPDSSFMIAFHCFGPEIFYSWFHDMGLNVPNATSDGREYLTWWGNQSALKGRSGFACLSPADVPFMKALELKKAGEGTDPLHDGRFRLVQTFGQGPNQISLLRFDMSNSGETPPEGFTFSMHSALRLDSIVASYQKATIQGKSPVVVTTGPEQWSYAASIPIVMDRTIGSNTWIHVRGRVTNGQVGFGVLDRTRNKLQNEEILSPSAGTKDIYVNFPSDGQADDLIVRNTSRKARSQVVLEETEILARAHQIASLARLEEVEPVDDKASIVRKPQLMITTSPERWAFAVTIPVHAAANAHWIVVKIRAHILSGEVGFSLLRPDGKDVQDEESYSKSQNSVEVFLPLPQSGGLRKIIIRSTAPNGTVSRAVLDGIETWQLE